MYGPVVQHKAVVAVRRFSFGLFWVNHQHAHQAHGDLGHFIGVGVVHVGTMLLHLELVSVGFAGPDLRLTQAANAVHAAG